MKLHSVLPTGRARKPVLLLSLGTFALGTDAFVISGVLPVIGQSLGVGVGAAGQLITIFSAVYAPAAPVLAVLTGNWNRRAALFVAMAVFVAANLLAAVAPNYPVMVVSRVLAALSAALFTPAASAAGMAGLLVFTLVLAALGFTGTHVVVLCVVLGLWSLIGWLFNPAQQQRLLGATGPTGPIALPCAPASCPLSDPSHRAPPV
ncbi:MFS transporter [Nonomuraea sp. NPDC001023]|uniref:MFS transporter n=1 Tax=unclassified Nonomuraea TaxID=2593643 RepID=UPI00332DA5F0